jgi:hypothetical protein
MSYANVLMHFAARLDDRRSRRRARLAAVAGARASSRPEAAPVLLVDYDRASSARTLIDAVRHRGLAPRLVGM